MTKILSWNVNGIRAAGRAGFSDWFKLESPEIVCIQETKAQPQQLDESLLHPHGYHSYWHSAHKLGYSGVSVYSKKEPYQVTIGIGAPEIDSEGRVITLEYSNFIVINAYFPNSQRDHARLEYKLSFCKKFQNHCESLKSLGKSLIIAGDLNIAHKEIDLKNPKTNQDNPGFLPEERAWMDQFLSSGYVDGFRHFTPDPGHYTWWSYRPGVREKNIGWRIDYFLTDQQAKSRLQQADHQPHVRGSDHCPLLLRIKD